MSTKVDNASVQGYLQDKGIKHDILDHKTVYTAIDAANTMKKKMNEIVKSLLVKADKKYFLVCLPADHNLDLKKVKKIIKEETGEKVKAVQIPDEKTMKRFAKAKDASLSAFGTIHDLPVILDRKLGKLKKAVFSSGKLDHSIEMAVKDFVKLENAILGNFGIKKKVKIIKPAPSKKKGEAKAMKKATKKKATPKKTAKKPAKKAVKKTAKKAVKKTVRKPAKKKAATKKTAKKKPAKKAVKKTAKKPVRKPAKKRTTAKKKK